MSELFQEVEQTLERGTPLVKELIAEPLPLEDSSPVLVEEPADAIEPWTESQVAALPKLSPRELTLGEVDLDEDILLATSTTEQTRREGRSIDQLLLVTAFISLLATGILWFFLRDKFQTTTSSVATAPSPTAADLQAAQNQDFLSYVGRSLDRIDRVTEANRQALAQQKEEPQAPKPSQTVVERIYIPMYQPPQVVTVPPSVAALPSPVAPAPRSAPAPNPAPTAVATAPNIAPTSSYKLIGILELGDRSAALFEVNSIPQRIQVGAAIGDSGWTLVSISNQEAIVRRNGEVRSIYVGQQF
jgi:Tfp pilus assembly protein PilP